MKRLFTGASVFVLGMLATAPKSYAECFNDAIKTVSDSGDLIVMESMEVFKIDLGDAPTAVSWTPSDHVLVCSSIKSGIKIIDLDVEGESVSADPV